jgi:hypothetical protein
MNSIVGRSSTTAFVGTLASSLGLTLASLLYRTTNLSGTGTHVSRGFPRPFYFRWTDNFQAGPASAGLEWLSFILNWFIWTLVVAAIVWALRGRRHENVG